MDEICEPVGNLREQAGDRQIHVVRHTMALDNPSAPSPTASTGVGDAFPLR